MQREIETRFKIKLPPRLQEALLDPSDPIRKYITLLTIGNKRGSFIEVNEFLLSLDWRQWPEYIVAFASGGCGDYFVFDTRVVPHRIYYIDPIGTVAENIASCEEENFVFKSFEDWYAYELSQKT